MKTVAIVQARMGSTRLPNKVMKPIGGRPMIELLLERLAQSTELDQIVVATSTNDRNKPLADQVENLGYVCVRGSEDDVLDRFVMAARQVEADVIVRITGDCPLVDPGLVDEAIRQFVLESVDYLSNTSPASYPDGLDIEVFTFATLERAGREAKDVFDHEHVTPYMRRPGLFTTGAMVNAQDLSSMRWTVDEPADFEVVSQVFGHFAPDTLFPWTEVLALVDENPDLFALNSTITRNEGAIMGNGQKLWKRAKAVIPGGNMLLSKRAEMFAPDQWPAYFSKAKGCQVWDLNGKQYTDMSFMGIGTNALGYGHDEVDAAVVATVQNGNMSTLNAPEEVYLAEKLVEIHPWADMVRFARSGGEANAIAVRIARAASGRAKVAVCGYHGWHDWYLSANLGDDQTLAGHLLPGLEPNGVPGDLKGTVLPFNYNNIKELEDIIANNDIGVIKMEVSRNHGPQDNFLHKVRQLATEHNIVLIFDECTSGFRQTFGGLHKMYDVEPDVAVFGKTLGNGYAVSAVIGRREIMEAAQTTFISSTFWTERIGSAAALKTLEVMEREKSWDYITDMGNKVKAGWQKLADAHGLAIEHWGLPSLAGYTFKSDNALAYKTLITQEMLGKGYLAGTATYSSMAHTQETHDRYFEALDPIFALIKQCEDGRDIGELLKGPVCHGGFKRLN
jgi:glutamate-1-semialdehyde 2,1-aminomutase